jgi:hypothetical protein
MSTLPHTTPSRLSHLTAELSGHTDDTLLAWQRACAQAAETRRGQHDEDRLRKALTLAQDGHVEVEDDGSAVVTSGQTPYPVQADGSCHCPDFARRRVTCKHALAVQLHQHALDLLWVPEEPLAALGWITGGDVASMPLGGVGSLGVGIPLYRLRTTTGRWGVVAMP